MNKNKILLLIFSLIFIIFVFGRNLHPFSSSMFVFHDATQAARVEEFVLNLRYGQIPPRMAPDFSYKMSYPIFDFYAPLTYWIAGLLALTGLSIIASLKLTFLLAIVVGFLAVFLFLKQKFDLIPSLLGAFAYITILYFPVNIFVRGNLGETWFLALFPLAFYYLEKNAKKPKTMTFVMLTATLMLLFCAHNILSLVSVVILFGYLLLLPHKKTNIVSLILAIGLIGFFLIPLIFENQLTQATYVATRTNFSDHFLCPWQLWQSNWGYGGSIAGCRDGMSFKIGKIQLVTALAGILLFLFGLRQKKSQSPYISLFFLILSGGSLFMTTYFSSFIWQIFSPILSLFQFPWRFIAFSMIGIVYFSVYFFQNIRLPGKNLLQISLILLLLFINVKYFSAPIMSEKQYLSKFLSNLYIEKQAAFEVPEYLPKTVDLNFWMKFFYHENIPPAQLPFDYQYPIVTDKTFQIIKNSPFEKIVDIEEAATATLNLHYFPYWKIEVNSKTIIPQTFDKLGRPTIKLASSSRLHIIYQETNIEKSGDFVSVFSLILIIFLASYKPLWKRITN